jgi:hypothetical protein
MAHRIKNKAGTENYIQILFRKITSVVRISLFLLAVLIIGTTGCSSTANTPSPTITRSYEATLPSPTDTKESPPPTASPTQKNTKTEAPPLSTKEKHTATSVPATKISATETISASPTATLKPTLRTDEWKELAVIPSISENTKNIYLRGIEMGNNPNAFSKIGDCGSTPAWFLGDFDRGPEFYELGDHDYLEDVIQVYQGSYGRTSLAARSGFNASSLFVPIWADRSHCESDETPIACEYRNHKPIIAFIMLGSNDVWHPEEFEPQMRKLIEFSIESGVIPILSTKADNVEEDGSINDTIARLAQEYEIPLWNYWLAVEPLPDHGLQEDNVHLTFGRNFFDDPLVMKKGWPIRNLTALQMLHAIWQDVNE